MDYQNRAGSKFGGGGVASQSATNADRRERLRKLALETIDLDKDPYFFKNHVGAFECRLCLTVHQNDGSYLAHTQGRKHQTNLARRAAREAKEGQPKEGTGANLVQIRKNVVKIGRPGYNIVKIRDPMTRRNGLRFQLQYPEIGHGVVPRIRFMGCYEQHFDEPPDPAYQYLLVAAEPYETCAFKVEAREIDRRDSSYYEWFDPDSKEFWVQFLFKTDRDERYSNVPGASTSDCKYGEYVTAFWACPAHHSICGSWHAKGPDREGDYNAQHLVSWSSTRQERAGYAYNTQDCLIMYHEIQQTIMKAAALWGAGLLSAGELSPGIFPARQPHQPRGNGTRLLTFNETVSHYNFTAESVSVDWLQGGEDGQYVYMAEGGDLVLENFVTGQSDVFVPAKDVPTGYHAHWIRSDLEKVLWATNYTKQYRHSYFASYYIHDIKSGKLTALVDDQAGDIQYAQFAPTGDAIAFVRGNNLFINNNSDVMQITFDGGPDMFHGVPDWVYEEEIFADRSTLWFSPDAQYLAFLSFNETGVPTYRVPYYMNNSVVAPSYPRELELRYPKVGATNPSVSFTLLDLVAVENKTLPIEAFPSNDTVIGEVAWVTKGHSNVVYRAFNRVQDVEKVVLVDVEAQKTSVIRNRNGTDGWIDNNLSVNYVGQLHGKEYYVDLSDISGWNHIYLFPVGKGDSIALTEGEWEVVSILKVDTKRQLVYYTSTEHHSTDRHVYSVSYTSREKKALVDDTVAGTWSASFSSDGAYYLLSYGGPDVPYRELYSVDSPYPIRTVTNNTALYDKLQTYNLPEITYFELVHPEGFTLNVMERLPANFNASKQYPVLFTPYGGPGSQQVSTRMASFNWNAYIASDPELEFITYTIDGRGTGFKGRAFRSAVSGQVGKLEAADQIWAAQELVRTTPYIDPSHLGMWGWSFGGYLTSKVVEADSGVFTFGLITAPVTDWRFYDSMYTERYMKTFMANEAGYNETAVRNATGFKNIAGGFAIMHGTGDDNVHYQNTAALVDLLVGAGVSPAKMKMMAFTDSDHGINYNGATEYIYRFLTARLWDEKNRREGKLLHQWGKKSLV